jgi:triacylglycerol esterase/lipase EstA (alpha/beta hydrolase family)
MGKRLAAEVQFSINAKNCGSNYHISFITHSLGGLIARSALTHMEQQRYHMKNFISLATPHLGHLYHYSTLNKLGMWVYAKFKDSKVMSTLLMEN